jgi:Tfp pilus assembly protein PilN
MELGEGGVLLADPSSGTTRRVANLSDAVLAAGTSGVLVALARRSLFLRAIRIPDIAKSEARRVVGVQLEQALPAGASGFAFDFHIADDWNESGRRATVYAMQEDHLADLRSKLVAAGIDAEGFVPACLGSAILANRNGFADCVVVAPTANGLGFDVIEGGEVIYSRETGLLSDAQEILAEAARTIAAAEVSERPLIAGGGLLVEGADARTDESPLQAIAGAGADRIDVLLETTATLDRREASRKTRRTRLSVLLCAAAALTWLWVFLNDRDVDSQAAKVSARQEASLRTLKSAQTAEESKVIAKAKLLQALESAMAPKQPLADVLTTVSNHATDGLWLTNFSAERGKPLQVRGTATSNESVSQYVTALDTDSRFRDVRLLFANNGTIETTQVVQFSVQAHITGNVPVLPSERTKR